MTTPADVVTTTLSATMRVSVSARRAREESTVMPETVPARFVNAADPRSVWKSFPARSTVTSAASFPTGTSVRPEAERGSTSWTFPVARMATPDVSLL